MKKIVLSIAAVMAAATFAPEASAVPVFARQTGMACSACHFQHFPLLNGFGRAFKSAGFTMMGAQEKVEGEHLSIPAMLNFGVLTTTGYEAISGATGSTTASNKTWFVPGSGGELSLFMGGRVSEFAGFLTETALGGAAATGAAKLALLFPIGDSGTRVGIVAHTSGAGLGVGATGQGVAYSFETLNTGAVNTHKMTALNVNGGAGVTTGARNGHTAVYSASQYLNTNTAATGISFVANNPDMGFINVGMWEAAGVGTVNAGSLPLSYVRVAGLFTAGDWDLGGGIQAFGGTSKAPATVAKATVIDFQAQGEVAGMGLGIYTSYGTAAASVAGATNLFNIGLNKRDAFGIGAELGVIPGLATVQLSFRSAKSGAGLLAANLNDNAFQIGGTYELAQNVELSLTHTSQSGSAWAVAAPVGKSITTLMMEALF